MTMRCPFLSLSAVNAPYMKEMEQAVLRVVQSGRYVGGPEVVSFEKLLSESVGAPYAVGVSNGLDALRLVLRAWVAMGRLRRGDEVIVAANTYVASVLAIVDAGLVPVLAEPDPKTLNLDTSRLEEYVGRRTRAVMPVHLYGRAVWDAALKDFVSRHGLLVLEDNAQAIGAEASEEGIYGGFSTGALGHAGAFSFYPTKNIGALGDAGAVVTHDPELASAVRTLANYGSDRRYHNIYKGYNCRLDPVQAAVLSVKLPHMQTENASHRNIARIYDSLISNPSVVKPEFIDGNRHVWHQYVVMTPRRDSLRDWLTANGVGTDIHYAVPPHLQPALKDVEHGPLPVTERIASQVLSLPVTRTTSDDDARFIASIINDFGS